MNQNLERDIWDEIRKYGPFYENKIIICNLVINKIMIDLNMTKKEAIKCLENDYFCFGKYKRKSFIDNYSWGVPTRGAIKEMKKFIQNDSVIEIGSGYGLWAKLLKDSDINIFATNLPYEKKDFLHYIPKGRRGNFIKIEYLHHLDALKKYGDCNALLICWPPYNDSMAYESLKKFKGHKFIYVGEFKGCCANRKFFDLLDKKWIKHSVIKIPQWKKINDFVFLFVRK